MTRYRAAWVLPVSDDPIQNGWVSVEDGLIADVGAGVEPDAVDLGRVVLMPALVNAHTHLELSYLHGAVPGGAAFLEWIRRLMQARRDVPDPSDPRVLRAARAAVGEARRSGTFLFGDVSNTLVSVPLLQEAGVHARVFYELLGFNDAIDPVDRVADARAQANAAQGDSTTIRVSLAPHAPYSVSPRLFEAIRADVDAQPGGLSTVHLGESPEEVEFLRRGSGGWRALLEGLGVWTDAWRPPGKSPVEYLDDLGFLDSRVLAVHGVQFDGEDLSRLAALGVTIVSCPRSNQHVGVGAPPLEAFFAMDVKVAFGTDSLASAPDMNLFAEVAEARRIAPRVPPSRLLESATLGGARALGFERELGSIEKGKRAELLVVRLPEGVVDVEEYLTSGIEPADISWLDVHG